MQSAFYGTHIWVYTIIVSKEVTAILWIVYQSIWDVGTMDVVASTS